MRYLDTSRLTDECLFQLNRFNDALIQTNTQLCQEVQPTVNKIVDKSRPSLIDKELMVEIVRRLRLDKQMGLYIQKEMDIIEKSVSSSENVKLDFSENQLKMAAFSSLWVDTKSNLQNLFDVVIELLTRCRDFCERYNIDIDNSNEKQFNETRSKTSTV